MYYIMICPHKHEETNIINEMFLQIVVCPNQYFECKRQFTVQIWIYNLYSLTIITIYNHLHTFRTRTCKWLRLISKIQWRMDEKRNSQQKPITQMCWSIDSILHYWNCFCRTIYVLASRLNWRWESFYGLFWRDWTEFFFYYLRFPYFEV